MKTFISLILITFISITSLYSQSNQKDDPVKKDDFLYIQMLIKKDLHRHKDEILKRSVNLTNNQKLFLLSDKKSKPALPFVLNLMAGFGIGSWVQGDETGGVIGTVGGVLGLGMMYTSDSSKPAGAAVFLVSWIADLILPWTYASRYNSDLRYALGDSDYTHISVTPTVGLTYDNHTYAGAKLSIDF